MTFILLSEYVEKLDVKGIPEARDLCGEEAEARPTNTKMAK